MTDDLDPHGRRLPIKLDSTSNGEFAPIPLDRSEIYANHLASERAEGFAKRLGVGRRTFLTSACGAASTLAAFNAAHAAAGRTGGYFEVADAAALEPQLAQAQLGKSEFIFDVQGHFVNPTGAWLKTLPPGARPLSDFDKAKCGLAEGPDDLAYLRCLGAEEFVKDVFLDSDTDIMVLSFVPSTREGEPLTIEEAAATRAIVERMEGSKRLMLHARVNPNQPGDVEDMARLKGFGITAFKTYTQWGPGGEGFWLTDDVGVAFIEKARELGVRNIAIHKGLPFGPRSYEHSTCRDIGPIAKRFPDMNFLIYHSGYVAGKAEGPHDPARTDGVDSLVTSLAEAGIAPNSNVYAELGSTWRFVSTRDPTSAAHMMGKLFKAVGEDNVLWGTDSIWYGSPQDQIQAFRTFQISDELQAKHGYPRMTPELRAKVFGLNAVKPYDLDAATVRKYLAHDAVARDKAEYAERPNPSFATYGPRNRREFMNLMRASGGGP
ncbi:amidohydrolase family protein [Phenylobacterium sp. SCN 70-31]|uniref:amidohydrolase family protein n=1 Tax=Phenylobacterium sp. SCN 70-31 TaxID=1660129 RepID=UPI000868EBDF|nr:amidohydrolase family protein [Phenylobacterium sp. SCN 70-31]ODT85910.1 MAG: amidohydrolase [Phenylobacterium sp. SCN 70-31]